MSLSKLGISVLMISTLAISDISFASDKSNIIRSINEDLSKVPDSVLEQEERRSKLQFLEIQSGLYAKIAENKAKIREASEKKEGVNSQTFEQEKIESNIQKAMANPSQTINDERLKPESANRKNNIFGKEIKLVSAFGTGDKKVVDVIIWNSRRNLHKNELVDGWKVDGITDDYLLLRKGTSSVKIYYVNAQ